MWRSAEASIPLMFGVVTTVYRDEECDCFLRIATNSTV